MCGLTGFLDERRELAQDAALALARRMADTLLERGPDDGRAWADATAGIAFGFRRLAILDLSVAGRQPMASADGRFVIVFNGEVYNAPDLRPELEARGIRFRGHSDTEVIVEACAAWGIERAIPRMIGMFAIALWDRETRTLFLARDRLGIKPLYHGRHGAVTLFASQPKAFFVHPAFRPEIDRDAVAAYLRFGNVPAPRSIYRGISQVRPGCLVTIRDGAARESAYWDAREVAAAGVRERLALDDREATDRLEALLRDSVRRRMLADVPVGAFLSGGIDSSTVVALMQAESAAPVKTFSIGYTEESWSEAHHAKEVAAHLGTEHHELIVEPRHALAVIDRLPEWFDEPFGDSSQIPTYLVSELTRRHVTVSLSGDGGDELFAGYPRYAHAETRAARLETIPRVLRPALRAVIRALPSSAWDALGRISPRRVGQLGARLSVAAKLLADAGPDLLYRDLVTNWSEPETLVPGSREPVDELWLGGLAAAVPDFAERVQLVDLLTYLPGDILTKVDRASMAVSLEARVPLLDHRVVELAWRLPRHMKVRGDTTKWLLRAVLERFVPRALTDRPKMGFGIPVGAWLRGPLRAWAEELLSERRLREDGILAPHAIRARWEEHLAGRVDWQYPLWVVLMFQLWKRRWLP
ncbi:MAG TPA: asparagine synthase (glutamine-hydrolyzing) [Myxococcota bacterium]|jgi:asparagine synthase (glutamine-hydrolysing)|nr:asparagine synthase (glutamine-hydrolyzing) [Myxococcota bacterium]